MDTNNNNEPTLREIKNALTELTEVVVFIKDNAVTQAEFAEVKQDIKVLKADMATVKNRLDSVENNMVTKAYLDNKLADLGAEIGARINRIAEHERKFNIELLTVLRKNSVLNEQEVKYLEELV